MGHPAQPGGGRVGGDGGGPTAHTHGAHASSEDRSRECLARAAGSTVALGAGAVGHQPGPSVGSGPEAPAGTGSGGDGVAAAVGGPAAAVSTTGAGAAAEVDEHVGQVGALCASGAAGSGGLANVGAVEDVVLSAEEGKLEAPDGDKDRGEDTRVESLQVNVKAVDTGSTPEGKHELAEVKLDKEGEGV